MWAAVFRDFPGNAQREREKYMMKKVQHLNKLRELLILRMYVILFTGARDMLVLKAYFDRVLLSSQKLQ